jgi:hypothetical protein
LATHRRKHVFESLRVLCVWSIMVKVVFLAMWWSLVHKHNLTLLYNLINVLDPTLWHDLFMSHVRNAYQQKIPDTSKIGCTSDWSCEYFSKIDQFMLLFCGWGNMLHHVWINTCTRKKWFEQYYRVLWTLTCFMLLLCMTSFYCK